MGLQLAEYNKWRDSFVGSKRNTIITDDGNCEGYLHLEEKDYFKKYFFVLNAPEMKFKQYNENPKKYPRMLATVKDLIDIRYISKVTKCTKSKPEYAFEIHTPSSKYVLSAKVPTEMTYWVTALTTAATNPTPQSSEFDKIRRCSSLESIDDQSFTTSIIGGVVIKTPVAASTSGRTASTTSEDLERNNKTNSFGGLKNLMEGWCWKQGLRMKNWKRRYFRLNTIKLSYYENDTISDPIRSIPSSNIQNVRILTRFCSRDDVIEVETPTRKFYMHVDDHHVPMTWKEALEKIMVQNGMYLPHTNSV